MSGIPVSFHGFYHVVSRRAVAHVDVKGTKGEVEVSEET